MEYVNAVNIITAIVVLMMIGCVIKFFAGDIGRNKTFYLITLVVLGIGLYLWRSGAAVDFISSVFGVVK
jgi:hypothetical protein